MVSRKAVPETLSWDGSNETWLTFEQKMRGALTQRNLGYMIDENFVDYYLRYGFEGVLAWFPDYAKALSSAQIQSDTTFFYGVLQGAFSTGKGKSIITKFTKIKCGIHVWDEAVRIYHYGGNRETTQQQYRLALQVPYQSGKYSTYLEFAESYHNAYLELDAMQPGDRVFGTEADKLNTFFTNFALDDGSTEALIMTLRMKCRTLEHVVHELRLMDGARKFATSFKGPKSKLPRAYLTRAEGTETAPPTPYLEEYHALLTQQAQGFRVPPDIWKLLDPHSRKKFMEARDSTTADSGGDSKTTQKPASGEIPKQYSANQVLIDEQEAEKSDDENMSAMERLEEQFRQAHFVGMEQARRGNMVRLQPCSCDDQGRVVKCHTEYYSINLARASPGKSYAISDSGADNGVSGKNSRVISDIATAPRATLRGFDAVLAKKKGLPIVDVLNKVTVERIDSNIVSKYQ